MPPKTNKCTIALQCGHVFCFALLTALLLPFYYKSANTNGACYNRGGCAQKVRKGAQSKATAGQKGRGRKGANCPATVGSTGCAHCRADQRGQGQRGRIARKCLLAGTRIGRSSSAPALATPQASAAAQQMTEPHTRIVINAKGTSISFTDGLSYPKMSQPAN